MSAAMTTRMEDRMFQYLRFGVRILHKQSCLMFIGGLSLGVALCSAIYSIEQGAIAQKKENSVNSSSQNIHLLEAGKSVESEIKGGEVHIYQINLRSGESVSGDVVQRDINVTGFFPDGSKIRSYGSPRNERKTFEIVAEAPGVYRLEIKPANNGGTVVYKLRTMEVLPISERLQYVAPEKYQSPLMAALGKELQAGNKSAVEKFWQDIEQSGTPLVEPIEGDDKNFLVTFLWRATFETWNVLIVWRYGIDRPDDYKMRRFAKSNLWYKTVRLPRGARFYYLLSPNDRLVSGGKDAQREATAQIDPLNPRRSSNNPNLSKYDMASAYVAMRNPETFGNVLAQSGSFWWSPKRNEGEEPNWLARQFIESRKLPLRFYLEAGIFEN